MEENILSRVPAPYVEAALNSLPNPATSYRDTMEVTIDVPDIGQVRVTATRIQNMRGRTVTYLWTALKAVATNRRQPNSDPRTAQRDRRAHRLDQRRGNSSDRRFEDRRAAPLHG